MKYKGRELHEVVLTQAAFAALFTGRPVGLFEFHSDGGVSVWAPREYADKLCNMTNGQNTISDAILEATKLRDLAEGSPGNVRVH